MIQWFKKHPTFLVAESKALAKSGNYKELLQKRDSFFVSHGNILVRYNGLQKHPILVFYLNSTPYSIPEIYPLSRQLTDAEVESIASKGQTEIPVNAIKHYYEYRHQNGNGALCILEQDNLDTGSEFYTIETILNRVREWYEAHITGEFPPDSEEIELFAHFNNINQDLKIIYSKEFLNNGIYEGDFIAAAVSHVTGNQDYPMGVYLGVRLSGVNNAGIFVEDSEKIHSHLKEDGFNTALDFETKKDLLERYCDEGKYLTGCWFDIEAEPRPFKSFTQLIELIGNGEYESGLVRLSKYCTLPIKQLAPTLTIAVRYKNRRQEYEFQMFTVHKNAQSGNVIIGTDDLESVRTGVKDYEEVKAVRCEKFTDDTYFQRNSKRADRQILSKKIVNIIGAGAIGSEVADILAKAGVGHMILVDSQVMDAHNSVRHLVGMDATGVQKVEAVKSVLEKHNPFIIVQPVATNIKTIEIGYHLPDKSISISSIADDNIEGFLNEQAVLYNKTVYYIRALRGGKTGRIFRVIPGKDACFYCLQLHRDDGQYFIDIPADSDFPTLQNECNNPIRPASAADLKLIAALGSGIIIKQLQNNSDENHWIWSTEGIDGTPINEPYKLYQQIIPIHAECPFCNDKNPVKVEINENLLAQLSSWVIAKSGIETGGVLAGFIEGDTYYITHASDAGPNAIETPNKFEKDIEYCQNFLDELYQKYGEKARYIGEWHSHPGSDNTPSTTDLDSLHNIANQKNYLIDKPIMMIFSATGDPACTAHPAGKRFYSVPLKSISQG